MCASPTTHKINPRPPQPKLQNQHSDMNPRATQKKYSHTPQPNRTALMLIAILLTIAGIASAQTPPQIGLKFGITNAVGLQYTNPGALLPTDLAGAFPQTNWNTLGRFGDNTGASSTNTTAFSVVDSSSNATGIVLNWD